MKATTECAGADFTFVKTLVKAMAATTEAKVAQSPHDLVTCQKADYLEFVGFAMFDLFASGALSSKRSTIVNLVVLDIPK